MSDSSNTPRLMAAATEFNIGKETLVGFLTQKGFNGDDLKPTSKLTPEMYDVLQREFAGDKAAKEKAGKVDLGKNAPPEVKKKKDEQDISVKKKETPAPVVVEAPPVDAPAPAPEVVAAPAPQPEPVEATPVPEPVITTAPIPEVVKVDAPAVAGPTIKGKIDLSTIDSTTRPKKATKVEKPAEAPKKETKTVAKESPAPAAEIPKAEAPQAEVIQPAAPEETATTNIAIEKLSGPKILGKIELPTSNDTRPIRNPNEKRQRIRRPVDKNQPGGQPGGAPNQGGGGYQGNRPGGGAQGNRPPFGGNRPGGGPGGNRPGGGNRPAGNNRFAPKEDKVIDAKEIQEKLKATQAKLAGNQGRGKSLKAKYRKEKRGAANEAAMGAQDGENKLQVTEFVSVSELANLMDVSYADVIGKCMSLGIMVSINQRLEADIIELVASEFNYEVEFIGVEDAAELEVDEEEDAPEDQKARAPIVTIMGHVDHGKTSLLDYIRSANVIAGEAGGITQHIGAYEVTLKNGREITFLDTPGHEAFTAMRARGAKVTDIAVIVVAADDAVMPQTKEAISHAQAANVPMIFAVNKIDKDGANPQKIYEQLAGMNILVESWGGKFQSQELSAKQGLNVDELLERILLETDILDLKANPDKGAQGTVIEASLDKGRGYVATILVQNGTLKQGDMIVSGQHYGKIKAMYNERNQRVEEAKPSTPVLILGLNGAPQAGETFKVYGDEAEARETAYKRGQILREQGMRAKKHITLDEIGRRLALGNFKELNVIIKGDVDGSVEALSDSLQKLSTEEIVIRVIHKAVGAISESDVTLANASDAIIIGFNVRPSMQAARLGEQEGIQIKLYSIIYNAIEEIKSAMEGLLEPSVEEKILANVEIRETYKFDKATVAGCFVLEGKIARNNRIRIVRDGIVIFTGELGSLKRFKDDAKEVNNHMECGLTIKNYNDIKPGDIVEAFEEVEVKRTL
jgi:translation initiation factor IF-2